MYMQNNLLQVSTKLDRVSRQNDSVTYNTVKQEAKCSLEETTRMKRELQELQTAEDLMQQLFRKE